ncbi:hypothetical protein ALC57_11382 [Trachymyrmex cornetzi]|uniref:Ig-like domain-containing protein n=1 Tax=Trachymyrmex cornetzi TaxID=471704 RepID=A0A151J2S2_9HYME|nr:hypothetical protein ALC57_11382 [Trachymyrmex cornetzi]
MINKYNRQSLGNQIEGFPQNKKILNNLKRSLRKRKKHVKNSNNKIVNRWNNYTGNNDINEEDTSLNAARFPIWQVLESTLAVINLDSTTNPSIMETEIINQPLLAFEKPPSQLENLDHSMDKAIFPVARRYPNSRRLLDLNASNKNLILSRIASPKSEITVNVQSPAFKGLNNKISNKRYLLVPVSKNLYVLKNVRESSRTGVDGIIIPKRYKLLEKDKDNATSAILSFKAHMHHDVKDVGRAYLQRGNLHLFDHDMNYLYSTLESRVYKENENPTENPAWPTHLDFLYPDITFQTDPNLIDVTSKISEEQVVSPVPDYENISLVDINLRGRINFYDLSTLSSPSSFDISDYDVTSKKIANHGQLSTLSAAKLNEVNPIQQNSRNYGNSLKYSFGVELTTTDFRDTFDTLDEYIYTPATLENVEIDLINNKEVFDTPQSREDDPKFLTESNEDKSITDFIDDTSTQYRVAFDASANEDNTFFPNITNCFVNNGILNSQDIDNQEYGISISSEYNNKMSTHFNDFYYNNRSIDEVLFTNYITKVDLFLNKEDYVTSAPLLLNTDKWPLKKAQSNVENSNALLMAIKPLSSELQKLLSAIQLVNQSISNVQSRLCDKKNVGSARTERESKNRNATNITKLVDKVDYYDSDFSTKSFNNQSLDKRRIEIEGKSVAEHDVKIRRTIFLNKFMTPFHKRKSSISDLEVQNSRKNFLKKRKLSEREFSKSGDRLPHSRFNRNLKSLTKNYKTRMKPIQQFSGLKKMKRTTTPILRLPYSIKSDISSENFTGDGQNHQENDQINRSIISPDNTPSLNISAKKDNSAHFLSDDKQDLTQRNVKRAMLNEISGSGKEKKFHPTDPQFYKEATAYLDILGLLGKTKNVEYATDVWTTQKLMESLPPLIFTTTEFFVSTLTFLPYFTEAPTITASKILSLTQSSVMLSTSIIPMSTTLPLLYMTELTMEETAISITDLTITPVVAITTEVSEISITIPMIENFTIKSVMLLTPFLEVTKTSIEEISSLIAVTVVTEEKIGETPLFRTTQTELMIETTTSTVAVLTTLTITKPQTTTSKSTVGENITLHEAESTTAIASSTTLTSLKTKTTEISTTSKTSTITEILFIKTTITEILPINKTVTTAETPTTIETSTASKILTISTIPTTIVTTTTETLTSTEILTTYKTPIIKETTGAKTITSKTLTPIKTKITIETSSITEISTSIEITKITEILTTNKSTTTVETSISIETLKASEIPTISTIPTTTATTMKTFTKISTTYKTSVIKETTSAETLTSIKTSTPIEKTTTETSTIIEISTTIETTTISKILTITDILTTTETAFTEISTTSEISMISTIPTITETTVITKTLTSTEIIATTKIPTIKKTVSTKGLTPTITETPSSTEIQIITEILTITESLGSTEIPVTSTTSITTVFFTTSESTTSSVTTSPKEFFPTSTLTTLTTIITTETAETILISSTTSIITLLQTLITNTTLSETPCTTISSMFLTTTKGAVTTSFKTAVSTTSLKVTTTTPLSLVTSTISSEMPNTTLSTFLIEETTASLTPMTVSSFETLHTKAALPIPTTVSTIEMFLTISSILTVNATVFSTTPSTITEEILKSTISLLTYLTVTTPSITQISIKPIMMDNGTTAYETTSTLVTSFLLTETIEGTTSSVIEYEETKESEKYYETTREEIATVTSTAKLTTTEQSEKYETTREEIATVTSTAKLTTTERTITWITTKEITIIEETTPIMFFTISFSVETTSEATSPVIETIILTTITEETLLIEKIVTVTPEAMIEEMSSLSEVTLISIETSTIPIIETSITSTSLVLTTAATTALLLEEIATEITETSLITTITTTATLSPTTKRPEYATILEAAITVTLAPFSEFILSIIITSETPVITLEVISTLPKTVSEEFTMSTTESPSITYATQISILLIETTIYPIVSISAEPTEESLEAETEYYVAKEPFYEEEYEEYEEYDTEIPTNRWYYYDEYETTTKETAVTEKYTKLLKEKTTSPPFIEGTTTSLYKIKTSEFTKYLTHSEAASTYINVTSTVATSGISYTEKITSTSTLETSTLTIVENVTTVKIETELTASAASKEVKSTTMWLTFGSTEEYTLPSSTTFKIPTESLEYLTIPPKYMDVERFTRIWLTSPKFITKPKEIPKIVLKKTTIPEQVSETETAVEKLTSFFISSALTTLPEREVIEVYLTTMSTAPSEMEGIIKTAYEVTTSAMMGEETIPSVTPFITSEAETEPVFPTMSKTVEWEQKEQLLQRLDNLKQHEKEMAEREERLKEKEKQWDIEKKKRRKMMQHTSVTYALEETVIPYTIQKSTSITYITKEIEEMQITDYITLTPYVTTSIMDLYNIGLASIETTTSYATKEMYTVSYVFETTPFSITEEIISMIYTMEKTEEVIEETTFTPYVTEEIEEAPYTTERSTSITYLIEEIEEMQITDYVTFTPYITTFVVDLYSIGLATIETTTPYTIREIYTTSYVTLYSEPLFVSSTITSPITLVTDKFITLPITTFSERLEEISATSVTTPTWYTTEETYIATYTDIYGKPLFTSPELEFTITLSTMTISTTTEKSMLTSLSTPVPPTERTTIKAQLTTQIKSITEKKENQTTTKIGPTRHTEMKGIEEKKQITYIPEKTVTQEEEEIMTKRVCLNVLENTTIPFDKRRRDIVTKKICLPYFLEKNEEKESVGRLSRRLLALPSTKKIKRPRWNVPLNFRHRRREKETTRKIDNLQLSDYEWLSNNTTKPLQYFKGFTRIYRKMKKFPKKIAMQNNTTNDFQNSTSLYEQHVFDHHESVFQPTATFMLDSKKYGKKNAFFRYNLITTRKSDCYVDDKASVRKRDVSSIENNERFWSKKNTANISNEKATTAAEEDEIYTVNVLHLNYDEDKQTHEVISAKPDEDELTTILFESNDGIYVTEFEKDKKITTPNYKIEEKNEDDEISDKMEKKIEEYNDYIEDLIEDYMNYKEHETSTQTYDGRLLDNGNKDKRMTENEKELLNQTWPTEKDTMYHLGGTKLWELDFVTEPSVELCTTTDKSKIIVGSITRTTCFDVVLKRKDKIKSNISYYKRHLNNNRITKHVSIEKRDASLENITGMNALRYELRTTQPRMVAKKLKRESQKHKPNHYKQESFDKKRIVRLNDFRCTSEDSTVKNRKLCIANANKLKRQIVRHEDTNKHKKKQLAKSRTSQNLHSLYNTDNGVVNKKNAYRKTTTANQYLQVGTSFSLDEIKALNCSEYKEIQDKIVISMDSDMEEVREFPQPHYNTESLKGQKYIKLEELEDNLKSNSELYSDNDVISLPGLNLNLPCNQDGNGITWLSSISRPSYTWKRTDGIALFGFVTENGDLELRNVNAKDTGNYTCVMTYMSPDNEESVETTYEIHLQVVTLPRYIVHGENRYHVRSCDEGDLDVLVTYLPPKLNNIICEADVCNAYVLTPSCSRSQITVNILLVPTHIVKLMTVDPKRCNVFCLKAIQDKLSLILSKNLQIFLGKTIIFRLPHYEQRLVPIVEKSSFARRKRGKTDANVSAGRSSNIGLFSSCPAGYGLRDTHCVPCDVGTYSEDGISHCKRCSPGTYQPNHGARVCRTCTNPTTKGCYNMLWNSFSAVMVTLASIGAMLSICLLSLWIICCAKKKFCVKRIAGLIIRENTFEGEKHVEEQSLIKANENEDQQWDSEYKAKKKKGKLYLHEDEWGSHRIKNVPIISPDSYRSHEDYNNRKHLLIYKHMKSSEILLLYINIIQSGHVVKDRAYQNVILIHDILDMTTDGGQGCQIILTEPERSLRLLRVESPIYKYMRKATFAGFT